MSSIYLPEVVTHDHIFRMTPENTSLFNAREQPSDEIKVKILLQKSVSVVLSDTDLNRRFTNVGMKASRDGNRNVIEVKGVRPYVGYGQQNILTVVQNLDRAARIIP